MGTKKGNIAVGNATAPPADPYTHDNLLSYYASVSAIEGLLHKGVLSETDYKKSCRILTKKHGIPLDSIFAEIA